MSELLETLSEGEINKVESIHYVNTYDEGWLSPKRSVFGGRSPNDRGGGDVGRVFGVRGEDSGGGIATHAFMTPKGVGGYTFRPLCPMRSA